LVFDAAWSELPHDQCCHSIASIIERNIHDIPPGNGLSLQP
jgi:hypothetical protein